jgi:predicted ATPase
MLGTGETFHGIDLLMMGHLAAAESYFWLDEVIKSRDHANQALALYTEERHGRLVEVLNHDPQTFALSIMACCTWILGYPDQAVKISNAQDARARRCGHPFNLGWGLTRGALVFDHLREPDELLKRVEEAERLGREHSLSILTELLVPIFSAMAFIRKGQSARGAASLKAGITVWEAGGGRLGNPYWKGVLAEGMAQLGDLDAALTLVSESIAQIERFGWEDGSHHAENLRVRGWILSLAGDFEGAEQNFLASLEWARRQEAKSWELRTSTSLARLWQSQGRRQEAYDLLAPIYDWFTEGFDTKDLQEAKSLLAEIQAMRPVRDREQAE